MTHYVLAYDRGRGAVLEQAAFPSAADAVARRLALERQFAQDASVEVVLLGAESEESLQRTHRRYFCSAALLAQDLASN